MTAGQYITDGTAVFIVRDTRDSTPVGRPITDDILRDSYVKRNGALLQRSSYPTLVKFLQYNPNLVTTEANWPNAKNLYTWGDGTSTAGTTFRVPDDRGLYEQLSDGVGLVAAGLPNIRGETVWADDVGGLDVWVSSTGAFVSGTSTTVNTMKRPSLSPNRGGNGKLFFDASYSNPIYGSSSTVTPPSVCRIAQMKY